MLQPSRSCLVEHHGELVDAALLLAGALADLRLNDAFGNGTSNLLDDVGKTLDTAWILIQQASGELQLSLLRLSLLVLEVVVSRAVGAASALIGFLALEWSHGRRRHLGLFNLLLLLVRLTLNPLDHLVLLVSNTLVCLW